MNRLVTTLFIICCTTMSGFALTVKDVMYKNGLVRSHKVYDYREPHSITGKYYGSAWVIPCGDSLIVADTQSLQGLIANDFDKFYHDTEIGKMSPLKRETEKNIESYTNYKIRMQTARESLLNDTIHAMANKYVWIFDHPYNMQDSTFTFELDSSEIRLPSEGDTPESLQLWYETNQSRIYIKGQILEHFIPMGYNSMGHLYEPKIKIHIANREVALAIDDNKEYMQKNVDSEKPFDFFYHFKVITDDGYPHFELTDILLVYNPTKQIVWSTITGDLSNEINLQ